MIDLEIKRHNLPSHYAKSGSAHNATPRYYWTVWYLGKSVGTVTSLTKARELARDFSELPATVTREVSK